MAIEAAKSNVGWIDRVKTELGRDRKKVAVLVALTVVAGVVGGRMLVSGSAPVKRAMAVPAAAAPSAAEAGGPAARRSQAESGRDRESYVARMERSVNRDLFHVLLELYPMDGCAAGATSARPGAPETGALHQMREWIVRQQSAHKARIEQASVIHAQAISLSLQSTMVGSSPSALINGRVLKVGDEINGFRIKSIDSDSCVVSKDGMDEVLTMNTPSAKRGPG